MGFAEGCGNGLDEDCDGSDRDCAVGDEDGDGFIGIGAGGADCDDSDWRVYPGAPDRCGDGEAHGCGVDRQCSQIQDRDGDGFGVDQDCDDQNAAINPWSVEACDSAGLDEDCDGLVNEVPDEDAATAGCGYSPEAGSWYAIDFQSDLDHCGGCRLSCCLAATSCLGEVCVGGRCRCNGRDPCLGTVTSTCCSAGCRDLTSDAENCGQCDRPCARNETCRPTGEGGGACLCPGQGSACPDGDQWACCAEGCVDLAFDVHNCGDCDVDCARGALGPRGDHCGSDDAGNPTCRCGDESTCPDDQWCTYATEPEGCGCADLRTDPDNCGDCGTRCDEGERCDSGQCLCPGTGRDCEGTPWNVCCPGSGCLDLQGDRNNCGGCGRRCDPGQACLDGECRCDSDEACDDGDRCTSDTCTEVGTCQHRTLDVDGDGWCDADCLDSESGGPDDCRDGDCDDGDPARHPEAPELCWTEYDDDCDGDSNDEGAESCVVFFLDEDHDGYYPADAPSECLCQPRDLYSAIEPGDCDDDESNTNPEAIEICNGVDDDCNLDTEDGEVECGATGGTPHCCTGVIRFVCCECRTNDDCPPETPSCRRSTRECH